MIDYIKKLQAKSEDSRKQILFGSLFVSMSFVFIVWVSSLGHRFNKEASVKTQEDLRPFALFGETISSTYNNITASVGNVPKPVIKEEIKEEKLIDLIPIEYQ